VLPAPIPSAIHAWRRAQAAIRQHHEEEEEARVDLAYYPLSQMAGRDLDRQGVEPDPPTPIRDDEITRAADRLLAFHDWRPRV